VIALLIGLRNRQKHANLLIAASLAASYSLYLIRGSVMLEFYVIPLLPFLALNIGLMLDHLLGSTPAALRAVTGALLVAMLSVPMGGGYVYTHNDKGQVAPQDLYNVPQTPRQEEEIAYVRQHIPTTARIIMDDDVWVELHDQSPPYRYAHSHWKAAGDPAIRDRLFQKDWQNIDYIGMSNKMRADMGEKNGGGKGGRV